VLEGGVAAGEVGGEPVGAQACVCGTGLCERLEGLRGWVTGLAYSSSGYSWCMSARCIAPPETGPRPTGGRRAWQRGMSVLVERTVDRVIGSLIQERNTSEKKWDSTGYYRCWTTYVLCIRQNSPCGDVEVGLLSFHESVYTIVHHGCTQCCYSCTVQSVRASMAWLGAPPAKLESGCLVSAYVCAIAYRQHTYAPEASS
jgi:hypothetical protein